MGFCGVRSSISTGFGRTVIGFAWKESKPAYPKAKRSPDDRRQHSVWVFNGLIEVAGSCCVVEMPALSADTIECRDARLRLGGTSD
jgi:hypothetical protein